MNYRKIKELQSKLKFSDEVMGKIAGISGPGYSKMLENKTCRVEYLENFARYFEKPIMYFFDEKEFQVNQVAEPPASYSCQKCAEKQKTINEMNATIEQQEKELLRLYRQINPDNVSGFEKSCG